MSDDHTRGGDEGALAAEYVLGVLSTAERRDFELRLAADAALRRDVAFWENRLGGLISEVAPIDPPPQVWQRVDAALSENNRAAIRAPRWSSLSLWRLLALGSATVAAASLAALVYVADFTPVRGPMLAKLDVAGSQASFVAAVDPSQHGLTIIPAAVAKVDQHSLQLWLIAADGKPRSLGLIEAAKPVHIRLPAQLVLAPDNALAVSVEPPGGSPTGLPTGPVIASGKLTNL